MLQVRLHERGVQGVVTTAERLSVAASLEGRDAQAFWSSGPSVRARRIHMEPERI